MRSRFLWITGCIVIALWAIGMAVWLLDDAAKDPLRLDLSQPGFIGRIGTTTTPFVKAIVFTLFLVTFVAFVVRIARTRTTVHRERPASMLDDFRDRLRRDYPKYSDRKEEQE